MAFITAYAFYNSTCGEGKPAASAEANPHETSEMIGKSVAAVALFGGIIALYILSIQGFMGVGAFSHLTPDANLAIAGSLAGLEVLTILGLALKACGYGDEAVPAK
jgi:hypothetical protein